MQVLSIGEVLWDVFPDEELLGGAPLNFSANTVRLGHAAALITGIANDPRGRAAKHEMTNLGIDTSLIQITEGRPTGIAVVTTSAEGEPRFEIPRPAAFDLIESSPEVLRNTMKLRPDWLYFGTLLQTQPRVEEMTRELAKVLPGVRCFYDMNLRSGNWDLSLVQRLSGLARVLKLNEAEAKTLAELTGLGPSDFSPETFCARWSAQYDIDSICVTLGAAGCMVYEKSAIHTVPGFRTMVKDTVGAGDAFAAAFLHGYHQRWPVLQTARFANAVGSVVASRAGATPTWTMEECLGLAGVPLEDSHAKAM